MSNENKPGPSALGKNTKKGASTSEAGQGVKITMPCHGHDTHLKSSKHRSLPARYFCVGQLPQIYNYGSKCKKKKFRFSKLTMLCYNE